MGQNENQSIREIGKRYRNISHEYDHLLADPSKLPPGMENLCWEAYNDGAEDVTFESYHPQWQSMHFAGLGPEAWRKFICKPGEWVFCPHRCYKVSTASGRPIRLVQNFGDAMFKGNKLPSRPDAPKVQVQVKR